MTKLTILPNRTLLTTSFNKENEFYYNKIVIIIVIIVICITSMYFICVFNHSKSRNTLIDNISHILRIYLRFAYEAHCSYTYHILYCFSESYIIIKHIYHILVYLYMDFRTNYHYLKDHSSVFARCISNGI